MVMQILDKVMKNLTDLDPEKLIQILLKNYHFIFLAVIAWIGIWIRLSTANTNLILDYDPWWFFRHAQEILNNGGLPPQWDLLS